MTPGRTYRTANGPNGLEGADVAAQNESSLGRLCDQLGALLQIARRTETRYARMEVALCEARDAERVRVEDLSIQVRRLNARFDRLERLILEDRDRAAEAVADTEAIEALAAAIETAKRLHELEARLGAS